MSKNISGCFSHKTDDWRTPSYMYDKYMKKGFVDPCPYQCNFDGLLIDYYNCFIFCNPPYSNISAWVDWLIKQWKNNRCYFDLLVPARTDTKWFHKLLDLGCHIEFIKGRLHFNDSKQGAPFPSIIIRNYV